MSLHRFIFACGVYRIFMLALSVSLTDRCQVARISQKEAIHMSAAWIVVADTSRARIFSADKPASSLVEIQTLAHPESRLHEGDLVSDKAGR
ncbi:MAG: host attachment protein, partial [Candidatus Sedimenticola sp. 6PFRAG5]